jgi:hypothetical protein
MTQVLPESQYFISTKYVAWSLITVFLIGCLIPAADVLFPRRYLQHTNEEILAVLDGNGSFRDGRFTHQAISEFLQNPQARLILGRLLYPRSFPAGKGVPGLDYPYTTLEYRRLVFLVIGPFVLNAEAEGVILPIDSTKPDLHASDVIVLGCKNEFYLDAVAVFVLSEPRETYLRPGFTRLECPLASP